MNLAKIENGVIVDIATFDANDIPVWASGWIEATDSMMIGMVDDGNGNFVEPADVTISPEDLQLLKESAYIHIDDAAEKIRLKYVTDGAGQAMTYQLKATEADAYITAGYPADVTPYPFIEAEASATGQTATAVANGIIAQRDAWVVIGSQIEAIRLGGKTSVTNATTVDEIQGVVASTLTTLDAF
jgi:hypothetical protein